MRALTPSRRLRVVPDAAARNPWPPPPRRPGRDGDGGRGGGGGGGRSGSGRGGGGARVPSAESHATGRRPTQPPRGGVGAVSL